MSGALRFFFVIAIIVTILHSYVSAQTVPICFPGYLWAYNSLQQSPCEMLALLLGFTTLEPLEPGDMYTQATNDECNTVSYSLLSACSLCQGGTWFNWSDFSANCTTVYIALFPAPIPSSTRIPHYAYLNVTLGNSFDPSAALIAGGLESSALASATTTATSATTSLAATTTFFILTTVISTVISPSPTSPAESKKSNAGAIAGGVVGGLSLLGIVAALIAFIILCRGRRSGPSKPIPASGRVYDPNDPTTFPINQPGSNP